MNNKELMNLAADNIRLLAVSMVEKAKSGHGWRRLHKCPFL